MLLRLDEHIVLMRCRGMSTAEAWLLQWSSGIFFESITRQVHSEISEEKNALSRSRAEVRQRLAQALGRQRWSEGCADAFARSANTFR